MNAEKLAKGFEKCRLLTRLLGETVENLDDYGCPKVQDLVGEGKADSCFSSYPFRHKTRLHCACREESKGVWRMVYATFTFVNFERVFCVCVYY